MDTDYKARAQLPHAALGRALAAEDWSTAADIIDSDWRLLLIEYTHEFYGIVRKTPRAAMEGRTSAMAVRSVVFAATVDQNEVPEPPLLTDAQVKQVAASDSGEHALDTALALNMAFRRRGLYRKALAYSDEMIALLRAGIEADAPWAPGRRATTLIQAAVAQLLVVDNQAARPILLEAYEHSGHSGWTYPAADAAGKIALLHALRGETDEANDWLDREAHAPELDDGIFSEIAKCLTRVARVVLAVDELNSDQAAHELEVLPDYFLRGEFWAYVLYARTLFALGWGDRLSLLDELRHARATGIEVTSSRRNGGIIGPLLDSAEANLSMSLGRGNQAWAVANAGGQGHSLLDVARSRVLLLSGDAEGAITSAVSSATVDDSVMTTLALTLIRAVALHRLGRDDAAVQAFDAAIALAEPKRLFAFACVPRVDLEALIARSPTASSLLTPELLARLPDVFPANISVLELTRQEQVVLAGLAAGKRVAELAAELNLSPSTVKSHQYALYRKLDASSTEGAVAAAAELGLLV